MTDQLQEMLPPAIERFGALVHGIGREKWNDPTPCTEWSVRDLVNHLVGEHLWAPHLLARESLSEVGSRHEGDLLGDDPVGAWDEAARHSTDAWKNADLSGTALFSFGEAPLTEYATQMLADLTIHGWDLARATGQDESLDPAAVRTSLNYAQANAERWVAYGIVAPSVPNDSTDPAVQLISLTGRKV